AIMGATAFPPGGATAMRPAAGRQRRRASGTGLLPGLPRRAESTPAGVANGQSDVVDVVFAAGRGGLAHSLEIVDRAGQLDLDVIPLGPLPTARLRPLG